MSSATSCSFLFLITDQTAAKKRPAVVVSSAAYNQDRPDLILMAITSQIKSSTVVGEVMVQDWKEAGLLKPSAIKPIMTTVEKRLVLKKLGQLKKGDQTSLREIFRTILG